MSIFSTDKRSCNLQLPCIQNDRKLERTEIMQKNPLENLCEFVPVPTLDLYSNITDHLEQLSKALENDTFVDTCKITGWWGNIYGTNITTSCRFGKESLIEAFDWLHAHTIRTPFSSTLCLLIETNKGEQFGYAFTRF